MWFYHVSKKVHISLVGKDHMRVSWITEDKHSETVVEYGTKKGEYSTKATGEHTSYHYFLYKSGKIHHVVIGPLQPGTTYFYRCGGLGPEFSFKTPPSKLPIEFVIVGEWLFFFSFASRKIFALTSFNFSFLFLFFCFLVFSWYLLGWAASISSSSLYFFGRVLYCAPL